MRITTNILIYKTKRKFKTFF